MRKGESEERDSVKTTQKGIVVDIEAPSDPPGTLIKLDPVQSDLKRQHQPKSILKQPLEGKALGKKETKRSKRNKSSKRSKSRAKRLQFCELFKASKSTRPVLANPGGGEEGCRGRER